MRKTKADFYHREINECAVQSDLKKSCSLINSLTGRNNKTNSITEISEGNCELPEEEINNVYIPNPQLNAEFQFHQINVENIALALMNLKTNKSTGLDKIPAKVLKLTADIIAPSLSPIYSIYHSQQVSMLTTGNGLECIQFINLTTN